MSSQFPEISDITRDSILKVLIEMEDEFKINLKPAKRLLFRVDSVIAAGLVSALNQITKFVDDESLGKALLVYSNDYSARERQDLDGHNSDWDNSTYLTTEYRSYYIVWRGSVNA